MSLQTSEFDNRIALLNLEGNLNIEDCDKIGEIFDGILDSGKTHIICIMNDALFISSPFLGKLMGCKLRLREKEGNMVMVGLNYEVREKLTLMGANRVFQFYSDIQTAYNYFNWDFNEKAQTLKLSVPPHLRSVPSVRRFISGIAKQKGYIQKDAFRIETIVDEIMNNAIEHGEKSQPEISMEFNIDKKKMNKTLLDEVKNLESLMNSEIPVNSESDFRGRGLALVKLISDAVDLSYDKDSTCVQIVKKREDN
ncbi:ATP-binding protein [Fibrobacterota bacterium]